MSGLLILEGRVSKVVGQQYESGYKMTITMVTEENYKDNAGNWVEDPSIFHVTEWGNHCKAIVDGNKIQKGFGLYIEAKATNKQAKNGNWYTNYTVSKRRITSRPQSWWADYYARKNQNPADQQITIPFEEDKTHLNDLSQMQEGNPLPASALMPQTADVPSDDDIPF